MPGLAHGCSQPGAVSGFGDNQGYLFEAAAVLPAGCLQNSPGVDDKRIIVNVQVQLGDGSVKQAGIQSRPEDEKTTGLTVVPDSYYQLMIVSLG